MAQKVRVGMHAARESKSKRLARVLQVLKSAGREGIDGLPLERKARVRAGGTVVSELRRNGHVIKCQLMRVTEDGSRIHRYTYVGSK